MARELGGGDVLPGQRVHGQRRDGVHVAAGDALQPDDVGLCVVRRVAVEGLVGGALGDVGLGVAPPTSCEMITVEIKPLIIDYLIKLE